MVESTQNSFKSPFVERSVPLEIDEGALMAFDTANVLEIPKKADKNEFIKNLARDNCQLLINKIWELPTEMIDNTVIATLPERKTVFPREKPVPKPKPLSKWQEYKKTKGLQTRKKDKMVWDEQAKEFRPRWGYKRANDPDADKNWFKELPKGVPMPEDPFAKERNAKKERVAKNELQRLRNVARSEKMTIPHQPSGAAFQSADQLTKAFHEVTRSTASLGKFQEKVRDEPKDFRPGKKQKFESNLIDSSTERKNQLKIIDDMLSNKPTLNKEKAGDRQIRAENREKNMSKAEKIKKGKKPRKAWLPPDKYEKSKKIEAMRAEKRERKGLPPKKSTLKKAMGGKGLAKGKAGKGGKGGKSAGKTAKMLKRAK